MTAANAEIVAITPIDYDHQQILGDTLAKIASEKAAIIRENMRVIVAPQKREAENVIYGKCREVGVEPVLAIPNVRLIENLGGGLLYLSFTTKQTNYKVDFGMQGKHQWTNATLAINIAESLRDFNFKIPKESIEIGLEIVEHKGRLEFWNNWNAPSFLFDGAHNISGTKALKNYLDEFITQPTTIVFGAMNDKNLVEIGEIIFPKAENLIFTRPDNLRSMETAELLKFVPGNFDTEKLFVTETVREAIEKAKKITKQSELILITGSLYLVGEAQKILKDEFEI